MLSGDISKFTNATLKRAEDDQYYGNLISYNKKLISESLGELKTLHKDLFDQEFRIDNSKTRNQSQEVKKIQSYHTPVRKIHCRFKAKRLTSSKKAKKKQKSKLENILKCFKRIPDPSIKAKPFEIQKHILRPQVKVEGQTETEEKYFKINLDASLQHSECSTPLGSTVGGFPKNDFSEYA